MTAARYPPPFPDLGIAAEHRLAARAFLASAVEPARVRAAVLTGDLAVGLGNAGSGIELDIIVPTPADAARIATGDHRHPGSWIRVGAVSIGDVAARARHLERLPAMADRDRSWADRPERWSPMVRMTVGEVLTADPPARSLLRRLRRPALRRALIVMRAERLAAAAQRTRDALEVGDLMTGLAASEGAVREAAEAILAAYDDVYVAPELLWRRMDRHRPLRELLWAHGPALFGVPASAADSGAGRDLLLHRLWLASHLTCQALLDGWDVPLTSCRPFRISPEGPVRSPYHCLLRFRDGFALRGPGAAQRVSPRAAILWSLLDGRPPGRVAAAFARCTGQKVDRVAITVRRTLARWEETGAVLTDASGLRPAVSRYGGPAF